MTDPIGPTDLAGIGKASVQLIQSGERLLERLIGPWLDEKGQQWADHIRAKRQRNVTVVAGQTVDLVGDLPLQLPAPTRIVYPLLNAAADEDQADMQAKWAALLANTLTKPSAVLPAFPRILADLSSLDARILEYMSSHTDHGSPSRRNAMSSVIHHFQLQDAPGDFSLSISNLERHGLISATNPAIEREDLNPQAVDLVITPFGDAFLAACTPPLK
jgi:hypothetical protein